MSYKINTIRTFDKQIKRLSKKHSSIKKDLISLVNDLMTNPQKGTPLGKNCFKIRLSITSKGKGKSGGARVITYVQIIDETIYLLSIYDKSEKDNLNEGEIELLLGEILD
jgi:mRNA-degrading endonuclease RelE of RelBE toxin-antitoxin system